MKNEKEYSKIGNERFVCGEKNERIEKRGVFPRFFFIYTSFFEIGNREIAYAISRKPLSVQTKKTFFSAVFDVKWQRRGKKA